MLLVSSVPLCYRMLSQSLPTAYCSPLLQPMQAPTYDASVQSSSEDEDTGLARLGTARCGGGTELAGGGTPAAAVASTAVAADWSELLGRYALAWCRSPFMTSARTGIYALQLSLLALVTTSYIGGVIYCRGNLPEPTF